MDIFVNGDLHSLPENTSLSSLLEELGIEKAGFAVAVNERVVPHSQWAERSLASQDKVMVIQATAGG